MIESLLLSVECVLPVLLLIALGIGIRRLKWVTEQGIRQMDKVAYRVLIPALLFKNIYDNDFRVSFDPALIVTAVVLCVLSFLLSVGIALFAQKNPPRRASLAQGMFRNNSVLYGIPILAAIYGQAAEGSFSILLAFVIPLNNILAVVILSLLANGNKVSPLSVMKSILSNPFVIATAAAVTLNLTGVALPGTLHQVIGSLGGSATTIALILLGASFSFGAIGKYRGDIFIGVGVKLVLLPLLFLPPLVLLGFRGIPLVSMYLMSGTPCAVTSHLMAKQMGADATLAGHLVVFGALSSMLTIFVFMFAMNQLSLI